MVGLIVRIAVILALGCACDPVWGESWSGVCVGVPDGDTLSVIRYGKSVRIRLFGIDCPERGQDFGRAARRFTSERAFGKTVRAVEMDTDAYGRPVAWVWVDGVALNKELVRAGLAWWYRKYAPRATELRNLEAQARQAGLGLWSHPRPIAPWEYRKNSWYHARMKRSVWKGLREGEGRGGAPAKASPVREQ